MNVYALKVKEMTLEDLDHAIGNAKDAIEDKPHGPRAGRLSAVVLTCQTEVKRRLEFHRREVEGRLRIERQGDEL